MPIRPRDLQRHSVEDWVFNTDNQPINFIVKGLTNSDLIHVDATNDRVGIGTATPATALDVNGTITCTAISAVSLGSSGDYTISGGKLIFTTAASRVVPGATSFSHRNNANSADNLLISDAGLVTVRAGLTLTAGSLTLGDAASKIVPGVTSISHRNNADSADNLLISDAGVVTVRAGLTLTAGDITIGATASRIIPGATSLSLRTHANDADNVLVTDAGVVTIRAGATITAGGVTITAGGLTVSSGSTSLTATQTVASGAAATLNAVVVPAATITISGNTGIATAAGFNLVSIGAPTLSAASALTITNAAAFTILGAPIASGAGPAAITNAYALWVQGGRSRFDGLINTAAAGTALTVTTNAITVTKSYHTVNTSGAAQTLKTINGGAAGDILVLQISSAANSLTIDNTGNCDVNVATVVLVGVSDSVTLMFNGTKWCQLAASTNV